MTLILLAAEATLISDINDRKMTRDDVAVTYRQAIVSEQHFDCVTIDWSRVNKAIVRRWSLSALKYIKENAWKKSSS